jgi:NAD(P)-dependent dehydrogenase (short-subunit alcohol dehydrogenase family)
MTVLVTGGTAGIGRAVAEALADHGHRLIIVGRDATRAGEVLARLSGSGHRYIQADLALMHDTARVADEVTEPLSAVVACAGVLAVAPEWTDDGFERTLALNYLSRFVLVRRLLPRLQPAGRIVLVANAGKYADTLDLDDLHLRRGGRGLMVAGRTQFANDVFAVELAERTGLAVSCVYPGLVATDVFRNARGVPAPVRGAMHAFQRVLGASPARAADTPVHLATDAAAMSGFYGPGRRRLAIPARVSHRDRRAAVWAATEDEVRDWLGSGRDHGYAAGRAVHHGLDDPGPGRAAAG